jgi:hypothetical protein
MVRRLAVVVVCVLALPALAYARSSFYGDKPLPTRSGATSTSRIEPRFGRVASSLAGKPTQVRCWSSLDWARINGDLLAHGGAHESLDYVSGFYWPPTGRIHLDPTACAGLVDLAYRGLRPDRGRAFVRIALAVDTLAHESMHRRGFRSEAIAECYAVQLDYRTATLLGASSAYASLVARQSWAEYPAHPAEYLSSECRNGGKLDLSPQRSTWP